MSYPSILTHMASAGIASVEDASREQLETALVSAFWTDLPLGMQYLKSLAGEVLTGGKRLLKVEDPGSPLGKQLMRLLGTDIARPLCEAEFGVVFGLYNCCSVVAASSKDQLVLSVAEQINLQNGVLAHADC